MSPDRAADGSRAEPQPERGNGHRSVKDAGALVETGGDGPEALECVERPLYFVPAFADRPVKANRPTARATTALAIDSLIRALGNGVFDLPPP